MLRIAFPLVLVSGLALVACGGAGAEDDVASNQAELALVPRGPAPFSTTATIDFDAEADGTPLGTLGTQTNGNVTFSTVCAPSTSATCVAGPAYARVLGNDSPNGVSVFATGWGTMFNENYGIVEADFSATNVSSVSIDVSPTAFAEALGSVSARPYLKAFDANGKLLGSVFYQPIYGSSAWGTWQTLTINAAGIHSVRFSVEGTSPPVYGNFDNLVFSVSLVLLPRNPLH